MFVQVDEVEETVIDLAGVVPHVHRKDQPELEDQEEKPFDDLYGVGYKEDVSTLKKTIRMGTTSHMDRCLVLRRK